MLVETMLVDTMRVDRSNGSGRVALTLHVRVP
jgi:hypothetical protein